MPAVYLKVIFLMAVANPSVSPSTGSRRVEVQELDSAIVRYDFDPRKAIDTLQGMGLTRAADGIFQNAAGQRMVVENRTRTHDLREKLLQVVERRVIRT